MAKKKNRRRGRRRSAQAVGPFVVDLPRSGTALIRLEIDREASATQRSLAERYWTPGAEGGWAEPVAALGAVSGVAADLERVCIAYLLLGPCEYCGSPVPAANRSRAAAMGGADLLFTGRPAPVCPVCAREQEERAAEQRRLMREREQELQRRRASALASFTKRGGTSEPISRELRRIQGLDGEAGDTSGDRSRAACLLYTLIQYARARPVLPPLAALPTGWMFADSEEQKLLDRLYARGWIRVDSSATAEDVVFSDDGEKVKTFYLGRVSYRLATSPEATWDDLAAIMLSHSTPANVNGIMHQLRLMQAESLIVYPDGLLENTYGYPPVPETRFESLFIELLRGLNYFTYGQMVCLCWRAADTSASWKERKQLTDAHASSAVFTVLTGKIDTTLKTEAEVPEYTPPRSQVDPPGLSATSELIQRLSECVQGLPGCKLHDHPEPHTIPCSPCLGMLYGGSDTAAEIREHFAALGSESVRLRPDLATKPQILE